MGVSWSYRSEVPKWVFEREDKPTRSVETTNTLINKVLIKGELVYKVPNDTPLETFVIIKKEFPTKGIDVTLNGDMYSNKNIKDWDYNYDPVPESISFIYKKE